MMKYLPLLGAILLLGGCANDHRAELTAWMAENSQNLRGGVPKLPDILVYAPVAYEGEGQVDPFRSSKLEPEAKQKKAESGGLQPDFDARDLRNSILEKYPLESVRMIGYLNINRYPIAVLQVEDKVKQVKLGDYVGQDFGMVVKISESELRLRELVQDSAGDWSERETVLTLFSAGDGKNGK